MCNCNAVYFLAIAVGSIGFTRRRLLQYLRFLQQEEYSGPRFLAWLRQNKMFDTKGSAIALVMAGIGYIAGPSTFVFILTALAAGLLIFIASSEKDPRVQGKIRLNMTERATRIFRTALALYCLGLLLLCVFFALWSLSAASFWLWQIVFFQLSPIWLTTAVAILQPGEDARQKAFLNEAKEKFAAMKPYVVGITGSYGKTSTKAILGKMLEVALGPTFWPQKGINTPMGITREIRERLSSGHKYAVIEMGAYYIGSIARLCDLTPPHAAVITAVGLMHLERFGGAENVFQAKSELARAVPADGILVCNGDNEGARRMAKENPKAVTLLYGMNKEVGPLDAYLDNQKANLTGTTFTIHWKDKTYDGFTPLHGRPALSNVLASFTMAAALGADPEYLLGAIRNLQPVSNRLEVKQEGSHVQINDAYNSNPDGFAAALEVLADMPGKRRILMTPGMIELGTEQDVENQRIAELAAKICDLVFIVGTVNRQALLSGLRKGGFDESKVTLFESRSAAFEALARVRQEGDIVLIENDLPDLFESDIHL